MYVQKVELCAQPGQDAREVELDSSWEQLRPPSVLHISPIDLKDAVFLLLVDEEDDGPRRLAFAVKNMVLGDSQLGDGLDAAAELASRQKGSGRRTYAEVLQHPTWIRYS